MINVDAVQIGCWIDGSHTNSIDFTIAVIDLAIEYGFGDQIDTAQYENDKFIFRARVHDGDMQEHLDYLYYDALDFLNDQMPEGFWFDVEDQSLYLMKEGDEYV